MSESTQSRAVSAAPRQAAMERFKKELDLRGPTLSNLLPRHLPLEKFKAMVNAAVSMNPELLDCTPASLLKATIEASELGLSLNPVMGECDILPVWDSRVGGKVAQCRPRYGGLMKLARQSGDISFIEARVVHDGDVFDFEYGLDPHLRHVPKASTSPVTHAYCIWKLANGDRNFEVMDRDQIEAIMKRSSAKRRDGTIVGPWVTDFDEMARKTVVRRASKYMPRTAEAFAKAVAVDNLHEGGRDLEIKDGEVFDVTEDGDPQTGEIVVREEIVRGKQQQQSAALEQRLTTPVPQAAREPEVIENAAPAAAAPVRASRGAQRAAPQVEKLEIPADDNGVLDYDAYERQALAAIKALPPNRRAEWVKENEETLDELGFHFPNAVTRIRAAAG